MVCGVGVGREEGEGEGWGKVGEMFVDGDDNTHLEHHYSDNNAPAIYVTSRFI